MGGQEIDCDVVIVGGGVAGSGLANNLANSGLHVVLLEQHEEIPPINKGDQLAPPAVRMLGEIGALNEFWKRGAIQVDRARIIGPDGDPIAEKSYPDSLEEPYNYLLRLEHPRIREALLASAQSRSNVTVLQGHKATDLIRDNGGRATGVSGTSQDGPFQVTARVVAGCDGPRSSIREQAGIGANLHVYPTEFLMLTVDRSEHLPEDRRDEFWTTSGFLALLPLSDGRARCPVEVGPGSSTDWRESTRRGIETLYRQVGAWLPDDFQEIWSEVSILDDDLHFYKVTRHHASTYVADGLLVAGDAAHTTSPFLGFGMNMALRDTVFAAKTIEDAIEQNDLSAERLNKYEQNCREFNQFVIDKSDQYFSLVQDRPETNEKAERALEESGIQAVFEKLYEPFD